MKNIAILSTSIGGSYYGVSVETFYIPFISNKTGSRTVNLYKRQNNREERKYCKDFMYRQNKKGNVFSVDVDGLEWVSVNA